jgi:hypothetical protein
VIQPIGFLCDHVEVLYDIDIAFQQTATNLGLTLIRAESLNDSGLLIDTLQDLALYGKDDSTFLPRMPASPAGISSLPDTWEATAGGRLSRSEFALQVPAYRVTLKMDDSPSREHSNPHFGEL